MREQILDILERLCLAQDRLTCAQIDAANCRTKTDWDEAHRAEEKFWAAKDKAVEDLLALIKGTR